MVKNFLIFGFSLLIINTIESQVRFGIKGGIQFTNVQDIHWNSETREFGIAAGGLIQVPLEKYYGNFFLRSEVLYSQQGEYDGNTKFFQNYINVPILLKYYLSDFISLDRYGEIEIFVEGGPQIGFLIKEKNKELDEKYYSKPNSLDLSLGLGTGISFMRFYELNIRYNYGITDIYKDYPRTNNTSNFAISLSYIF